MSGGGLRGNTGEGAPRPGEQIALQCRDSGGGARMWCAARVVTSDAATVTAGEALVEGWRSCVCVVEWLSHAEAELPTKLELRPHAGPNWRRGSL